MFWKLIGVAAVMFAWVAFFMFLGLAYRMAQTFFCIGYGC